MCQFSRGCPYEHTTYPIYQLDTDLFHALQTNIEKENRKKKTNVGSPTTAPESNQSGLEKNDIKFEQVLR